MAAFFVRFMNYESKNIVVTVMFEKISGFKYSFCRINNNYRGYKRIEIMVPGMCFSKKFGNSWCRWMGNQLFGHDSYEGIIPSWAHRASRAFREAMMGANGTDDIMRDHKPRRWGRRGHSSYHVTGADGGVKCCYVYTVWSNTRVHDYTTSQCVSNLFSRIGASIFVFQEKNGFLYKNWAWRAYYTFKMGVFFESATNSS